jgi:hypothetical protein
MSQNDSSSLIDSPAAGKIGEHRALYFSEEEGKFEKFRPYGFPDDEWLEQVRQQLGRRPIPEAPPAPVDEPEPESSAAPGGPPPPPTFEAPSSLTLEPLGTSSVYGNWAPLKTIEIPDDVNFDEEPRAEEPAAAAPSAEAPSGDGNGTAEASPPGNGHSTPGESSPNPTEVGES